MAGANAKMSGLAPKHASMEESDDMEYYTDDIRDGHEFKKHPAAERESSLNNESPRDEPSKPVKAPEPEPEIKYPISSDLKAVFRLIEEYAAEKVEFEPVLKPFLLDYVPAVGDVDPFIKIPRPDLNEAEDHTLGLTILDEPAAAQSDPTIIGLQLQQLSNAPFSDAPVKKVTRADKNTQQIEKWIENIKVRLHT